MKNVYKFVFFLILSGTLFISLIFFIPKEENKPNINLESNYYNNLENNTTGSEAIKQNEVVTIFLQENKKKGLQEDKETIFYSKSLQPTFT